MERLTKTKKIKRKRKHGYMNRKATHAGKKVIKRRIKKGRKRIAV